MTGHPKWATPVLGPITNESTYERRVTLSNDNGIVAPDEPDSFYEDMIYKGKFFTRGCRGILEQIQLYCIGDGADEITLRYSPHPCIGPFAEVTITPAAVWGWQDFNITEMWNYDSLFIWISATDGEVDWGFDRELPYDGHHTPDGGSNWRDTATRPFIRAVMTGMTPGDVPVSGVVNTIDIPSIGAKITDTGKTGVDIPNTTIVTVTAAHGAGTMLEAQITFDTSEAPTAGEPSPAVAYELRITTESGLAYYINNRILTQSCTDTSGRCAIGEFYQCTVEQNGYNKTVMTVRLPIKFRRYIQLGVWQSTGAATTFKARMTANMVK